MRMVTHWTGLVILAAVELGCLAVAFFSAQEIRGELRLRRAGVAIDAQVGDRRVMTSAKTGTSYEVQYTFDEDGTSYSRTDGTGRKDLWTSVTPEEYEQTGLTRIVRVVYLPADPWVNRPEAAGAMPLGDPIIGLAVFGVLGVLIPAGLWNMQRKAKQALEEGRAGSFGPWSVTAV